MQVLEVAQQFETGAEPLRANPNKSGRINQTWVVDLSDSSSAVLQKINSTVFRDPSLLMANFYAVSKYLSRVDSPLLYLKPFITKNRKLLFTDEDNAYWRAYRFIPGVIERKLIDRSMATMLGQAAGEFHRSLNDFPVENLSPVLPNYHNTPKIYSQFTRTANDADPSRIARIRGEVGYIHKQRGIMSALLEKNLPARVTHNSICPENLILDTLKNAPVALIDYDTIMPGILAFDFGDGVRSICSTCAPDEQDMKKVVFNLDLFTAYTKAFLARTRNILDASEPSSLVLGCIVMTLEHGMRNLGRFLTAPEEHLGDTAELCLRTGRIDLYLSMQMKDKYQEMVEIIKGAFNR